MSKSESNRSSNCCSTIFIVLLILAAFGPVAFILTNVGFDMVSWTWAVDYSFLWSRFSIVYLSTSSLVILIFLPKLFFIAYATIYYGEDPRNKKTILFGVIAELPIIIMGAYSALFPPPGYSYFLATPIPVVLIVGIAMMLLRWRRDLSSQAPADIGGVGPEISTSRT